MSAKTAKSYLAALKNFCLWSNKNPHQLIIERDAERNIADPNKRTGSKNLILDFRGYLESQGYLPKSINSMDGAMSLQREDRLSLIVGLADDCIRYVNDEKRSLGIVKPIIEERYFSDTADYDPSIQTKLFGDPPP